MVITNQIITEIKTKTLFLGKNALSESIGFEVQEDGSMLSIVIFCDNNRGEKVNTYILEEVYKITNPVIPYDCDWSLGIYLTNGGDNVETILSGECLGSTMRDDVIFMKHLQRDYGMPSA